MAENLPLTQLSIENGLKNLRVKISRHHLETILRHLVQNALESYADDDDHRVCMRIERQKKNLLFRIQDFGSGVREEDQIRIFDPFFTTRRRGIGTGMGLSLTQWLVEGYGGKIDFKSAPFEGTVVSIQLPLIK